MYSRVLRSVLTGNATSNRTTKPLSFRSTLLTFNDLCGIQLHDKPVPVTTPWSVLRLRMEERPPIWRVAANILNKQSWTADEGWSPSLGVGRGANNTSPYKRIMLRKGNTSLGTGLIRGVSKIKVKQSRYRPGVAQRVSGS